MNPILKAGHGDYVRELYDQGIETNIIKKLLLEEKFLNVPEIVIKRFLELPQDEPKIIEVTPPSEPVTVGNIDDLINDYGLSFDDPIGILTHLQKTHVLMYLKVQDVWFREAQSGEDGNEWKLNNATRMLKTMAELLDKFTHISLMANESAAIALLERKGYHVSSFPQSQTETETQTARLTGE